MEYKYLYRNNHNRLIVIFAGWSTDPFFYSHIIHPGWDIVVFSDYTDFNFPTEILEGYATVALFAWSLGVYAASRCFPFERASVAVAVNGTEKPVDDSFGIPENIFLGTVESLNERNLIKFRRRMAGESFKNIFDKFSSSSIEQLKYQLIFIGKDRKVNDSQTNSVWHRAYVSKSDMIFPATAQISAWNAHISKPQIVELDAPHYVDLLPIIKTSLPQHDAVGKRFEKALPTYNDTAAPQNVIAAHLVDMAAHHFTENSFHLDNILEIGPGTGFLTNRFASRFHPLAIDFVELYQPQAFNVAEKENYYVADAEEWIADKALTNDKRYDIIISASTIQWFINPERFFRNAARLLKPGGVLLCSSFLPGNLIELQSVNPYGLVYHSAEELSKLITKSFTLLAMEEEVIVAEFESPRATLAHLIKTGVGGSAKSQLPVGQLLHHLPTHLTYTPLYFLAQL